MAYFYLPMKYFAGNSTAQFEDPQRITEEVPYPSSAINEVVKVAVKQFQIQPGDVFAIGWSYSGAEDEGIQGVRLYQAVPPPEVPPIPQEIKVNQFKEEV